MATLDETNIFGLPIKRQYGLEPEQKAPISEAEQALADTTSEPFVAITSVPICIFMPFKNTSTQLTEYPPVAKEVSPPTQVQLSRVWVALGVSPDVPM